jgi:hypothetical protein
MYYDTGLAWVEIAGLHNARHHPLTGTDKITMSLSGALVSRPDPALVAEGTIFFAVDQLVQYAAYGSVWYRMGLPAGAVVDWFTPVAPAGWISYDGSPLPATTGIYADLYAALGSAALPDTRGRMTVGIGPNSAVDNVLDTEGMGNASQRSPIHTHDTSTLRVSGRTLSWYEDPYYQDTQGGGTGTVAGGGQGGWVSRIMGIVASVTGKPLNAPAYIACMKIGKL